MHVPHELQDEFPDETRLINRLGRTNYLLRRIAGQYNETNRQIYLIESGEEPTTDEILEQLKKRRLKLKDQIAGIFLIERRI